MDLTLPVSLYKTVEVLTKQVRMPKIKKSVPH